MIHFNNPLQKKPLSPTENVNLLKKEAKRKGLDKDNLATSMGGIETDHSELLKSLQDAEISLITSKTFWWARISRIVSITSLILSLFSFIKK